MRIRESTHSTLIDKLSTSDTVAPDLLTYAVHSLVGDEALSTTHVAKRSYVGGAAWTAVLLTKSNLIWVACFTGELPEGVTARTFGLVRPISAVTSVVLNDIVASPRPRIFQPHYEIEFNVGSGLLLPLVEAGPRTEENVENAEAFAHTVMSALAASVKQGSLPVGLKG